jgi:hypothetical protein
MEAYEGVDVEIHVFLTSALVGSNQLHAPAALSPGKESGLNRRLSGPLNQSGRYGEFKILDPTGTEI